MGSSGLKKTLSKGNQNILRHFFKTQEDTSAGHTLDVHSTARP